jgi:pSer/pThr/pTyr-binding forkhead associated (FHA) protein
LSAVEEKETAKAEETVTETATEEKTEEIADVEEVKAFLVREVIETDIEEGTEEKVEQEIPISKNGYVIGSSENADLVIDETEVFPEHARITMKNDEYFIKDLGSATGTFMNGADISQMDDEFPVINGSKIRIGQQEFKFVIK